MERNDSIAHDSRAHRRRSAADNNPRHYLHGEGTHELAAGMANSLRRVHHRELLLRSRLGVAGVASAYVVALAVLAYPAFAIPFRLIRLKFADLLSTLRPYAIATALMALQVIACRLVLEHLGAAISLVLIAGAITGALVYAIFIFYMRPVALGDLQKMLK